MRYNECIDTVNRELIDVIIRWVYSYLCSNSVNMDDIVFSATVIILGNEFKFCFVYKIYYDIYIPI